MGHKPTLLVALLAIAMSISYVIVPTDGKFIFLVFMVVSWFLVAICWLAQKSADYITNQGYGHNEEKKKLVQTSNHNQQTVQLSSNQLSQARVELTTELDELRNTVKDKENEIEHLKKEIASLQTLVQIESIRTELANLKTLVAKENSKKKKKK